MKRKESATENPPRRQYDAEFKASAVRLVQQGRSLSDVSRSLGVHVSLLRKWKIALEEHPVEGDAAEVEKLRRYVRQLEMERDILKKALSIFSHTT